jgi:hypothetical protein
MLGFLRMAFILLLAVITIYTIVRALRESAARRAWQRRTGRQSGHGDMAGADMGTMGGSDWAPDASAPALAGGGGGFDGGGASGDWSGGSSDSGGGGGGDSGGGGDGGGGGGD